MKLKRRYKWLNIERNNKFVNRILFLSIPSALVLLVLAIFNIVSPLIAVLTYAAILVFNSALLLPINFELQQLKKYTSSLASGENFDEKDMPISPKETKEIIKSINAMHRFWAQKTDDLEAQSISDAAVLDTLPDPIMMIDRAGNIIGANLSSRNLFGRKITDKNIEKLFDSNNFIEAVNRVLKKESEAENLIFYIHKPKEQKLYAHIKQLPWISKGRAVAVISLYDMTRSMKIEKMQSDFVANASHELRTPLAIISGFIETLLTTAKDDAAARENFLKIMQDQTAYMSSLIENLLSLSRIELSMDDKPHDVVHIAKIVDEVKQALSLKAKSRDILIVSKIDDDVTDIIADGQQIKQLIQNLSDNAIKYGLSQSDVAIKVKMVDDIPASKSLNVASGPAVAISITNKGPKISSENIARLTERFFRMQEHKDLNIKGTGLGLSIAKQIIVRHHGNLTVRSGNLSGTTFTVYLPKNPNPSPNLQDN